MRARILLLAMLVGASAVASEITPATVLAGMNARRAAVGLPALRQDSRLDQAAADRMTDMEDQSYWAHLAPDGRSPFTWLKPHGYDYERAGENLAAGFETAEVLMDAWMESAGHRDNILSPYFEDCGIAIVDGSTTRPAVGRSVVVMFARQRTPGAARAEDARADLSAPSASGRRLLPMP